MKVSTKTIISTLVASTIVGAGAAVADSHQPSWQDYRSTVTQMPISKSYNDIDVRKYDQDTTTNTSTDDSYNTTDIDKSRRSIDVDLDKSTDDSYNTANIDKSSHSKEFDLDKSTNDSYNRRTDLNVDVDASRRMKDSYNTDNSKYAADSYNTDKSRHAKDSYNTDDSVNDSYNTWNNQREAAITDRMDVSQLTKSMKDVSSGDVQQSANDGYLSGHTQAGHQGGVDVGGIGNDAPSYGGGYGGGSEYGYGGADKRKFRNDQEIAVYGPNLGAVSNTNVVNQGRDLVFGPNRSAIGNDFGNKQVFSAGDQAQLLKNDQFKSGDNAANAVDNVNNTATKSATTSTQ